MENSPTWIAVAALALRRDDGRWLMHRRPADKHHGGLWEFPGGKVEPGEMPDAALVREIREELGIAVDRAALAPAAFAQGPAGGAGPAIVILLYTAKRWRGEPAALEGGEVAWFAAGEIAMLDRPPLDVALCDRLFSPGTELSRQ